MKEAKNWRLNGELIVAPDQEPDRYNNLQKDDLAVLEFSGEPTPDVVRLDLISQVHDKNIHNELMDRYGAEFTSRKAMLPINHTDLDQALTSIELNSEHALFDLATNKDLGDVAQGGEEGIRSFLRRRRSTRGVSSEELEKARRSAASIGRLGEEILKNWLEQQPGEFLWDADENAISPYDFTLLENEQPKRRIDAKSTKGEFSNMIHISLGELEEMANGELPYDIYRLYSMTENGAKLRICRDMKGFADNILKSLEGMPDGVRADSISVKTNMLPAENEILIDLGE